MSQSTIALPDEAHNVLLLGTGDAIRTHGTCSSIAVDGAPDRTRVVAISYLRDAETYREQWRESVGTLPEHLAVIEAQDAPSSENKTSPYDDTDVLTESPDDLMWLGIHANEYLTRWHDVDDPVALCLDSLSVLLQYVSVERAYKFLHVLTGRIERAGAKAHYHMNPTLHDTQEINTVKQLCDSAVEYDPASEEWAVQSR